METRVYIFAGFLDSGKTSFINDTLMNPDFYSEEDTLLISFEEGEVAYNDIYLKKSNTSLVTLDFENFTTYDLKHLELEYRPTQIMIEANGMMDLNIFVKETIPENWKVVQVLTTFDTTTFSMYLNNMRSLVDHDFGIFCMDAMDHPDKYNGKTVKIKGKFIGLDRVIEDGFVLGRQAMVCCEEDTSLIGLVCISKLANKLIPEEWIVVEGKITVDYDPEYQMNVPILTVEHLDVVPPLKNQYVTFD